MDLSQQYATLILMLLSGAVMGIVYDVYRTAIKEWRFLRNFSALWDVLYWVVATVFVFTMLLGANHGDVRIVVFVLLGAGWWLYTLTIRSLVVAVTTTIIRGILAVLHWLMMLFYRVVVLPLFFLFKVIWRTIKHVNRAMEKIEIIIVWPIAFTGKSIIHLLEKKEEDDDKTNN